MDFSVIKSKLRAIAFYAGKLIDVCLCRICHILPIDENLVVLESEGDFCDNAWALYEYLERNSDYRFVWVVANPQRYNNTARTRFLTRFDIGTHLRLMYCYAVAKFSFYTHCTYIPYQKRRGQTVVLLGHGASFKAPKGQSSYYFDFALAVGNIGVEWQAKFMGRQKDVAKILPLGYPRNDLLLENLGWGTENPFVDDADVDKVIVWMPTYKASVNSSLSERECDNETGLPLLGTERLLREFDKFLQQSRCLMVVKIHHLQASKEVFTKRFANIKFITDGILRERDIQLYQMVGKSDALLTDYSSISIDYLLTGKPMGFILDDFDMYVKSRGFFLEADQVKSYLVGSHIYIVNELKEFVKDVCGGKDQFVEARKSLCCLLHAAKNGEACRNICQRFGMHLR